MSKLTRTGLQRHGEHAVLKGVPGAAVVKDSESKTSNKNAKGREAREKAKTARDPLEYGEQPSNGLKLAVAVSNGRAS